MRVILSLLFILFSTESFGVVCNVYVSSPVVNFSQTNSDQSVAVDVYMFRYSSSNKCKNYELGISKGSASSYSRKLFNGGNSVNYNVYGKENTTNELWDVFQNNNGRKLKFSLGFWFQKITLYVKLPYPNTALQNGLYTDTVQIQVRPRSGGTTGGGNSNLTTNLNIQSDINISLVGRGGQYDENQTSHTLNFGNMVTGKVKSLDLIVKANTGYRINVSSEYNGVLAHNDKPSYTVGYNFGVNGTSMSLVGSKGSPKQIFSSNSPNQNGEVIEIDVSLLNTGSKLSGTYTDYIYFTAISN